MVVMNNDGDLFDERRKDQRRKSESRRSKEKEVLLDRREEKGADRRSGNDRRKKDINK